MYTEIIELLAQKNSILWLGLFLEQLSHKPRGHRPTAFSYIEPLTLLERERVVDLAHHFDVITGGHHFAVFDAFGPVEMTCFVWRGRRGSVDFA